MPTTDPSSIRDFLRRLASDPQVATRADRELLRHFLTRKDDAAFEAIVRRHGPMVFDVCRNLLANAADAEDAFQATFLILARKADSIRNTTSLASWLHGVAYRTACQARTDFARRRRHEARGAAREPSEAADDLSWREAQAVVHQELAGLADRYRSPLVLCYLEGKTQEEAAAELGIAKSTLRERLDRGRSLLRVRLAKRGLGPVALLLAAAWPTAGRSAHVPITLTSETLAITSAGGSAASARVIELTDGVLHAMQIRKTIASVAATLAAVAFVGFVLPVLVGSLGGPAPGLPVASAAPEPRPAPPEGVILAGLLNPKEPENVVEVLDTTGKSHGHLTLGDLNNVTRVRVSPDGTRLAFTRGPSVGDGRGSGAADAWFGREDLYVVYLPVTEPPKGPVLKGLLDPSFAWAADSKTLFLSSVPEDADITIQGIKQKVIPRRTVRFDPKAKTEEAVKLPEGHAVQDVSPDGKALLTMTRLIERGPAGLCVFTTHVVPLDTLKPKSVTGESDGFAFARFSPDGARVAGSRVRYSKSEDRGVFVVDLATGKSAAVPLPKEVPAGGLNSLAWSPDGKRLAMHWQGPATGRPVGGGSSTPEAHRITVLDADGLNATTIREFPTERGPYQIDWADPKLTDPGKKKDQRKDELPVREPIKAPVPKVPEAEWKEGKPIKLEDGGRVIGVACSPDGKAIAVAQPGRVTVLDATTRKVRFAVDPTNPARITAATFSPKGDRLAVTRKDAVDIYRVEGKLKTETWELTGFDPHRVAWAADPDGGEHLVATNGAETRHWDAKGKEHKYPGWAIWKHQPCVLTGVPGKPSWLMQFDDGGMDRDMTDVWLWSPADGRKSRRLTGHKYRPDCAAASAEGAVVVTGYGARHLVVWDGGSGKKVAEVPFEGGVLAVAVAADGKTVAVLEATSTPVNPMPPGKPDTDPANWRTTQAVTLFATADLAASDRAAPKPLLRWATDTPLTGFTRWPCSLAFSSDGKTLLAAFADPYDNPKAESQGVRVWELVPKR